jgi:hypothetical protein
MLSRLCAFTVFAFTLLAAASPAPPAMTVPQILSRMAANYGGLNTYEVPVTIDAHIHKGITIPVSMSGKRYFQVPDREALKMNSVPSIAKAFQNVYSSLGTPVTWPKTYKIDVVTPTVASDRPIYELRAVYKHPSNVDHIMLDVDGSTFDPLQARWYYKNGATIVMNIQEQLVQGKYRLPQRETLEVHFPQYNGDATVSYGTYIVNQPIPDTVFTQNK